MMLSYQKKRKMNRVTDVAIPEKAFVQIGEKLFELWEEAEFVEDKAFSSRICLRFAPTWRFRNILSFG